MAAKKTKPEPRNTQWKPELWARRYRGLSIWVEQMYATAPKWNWTTEQGPEGRAVSKAAAMRAAMRAVDAPEETPSGSVTK